MKNKLFILLFGIFTFLAFPAINQTQLAQAVECGPTGCCGGSGNTYNGKPNIPGGVCMNPISGNNYNCPGGIVDQYCGGAANHKCCVPTNTACYTQQNGKCQTPPNYSYSSQSCSTQYVSNLCPGGGDSKCCINQQPPPPPPAVDCGDVAEPIGSVLSNGVITSASAVYGANYGPEKAVDGVINDEASFWSAGALPPQWIELNLGAPQTITGVKLFVRQYASNNVTNVQILTGDSPTPTIVSRTISNCSTTNGQVLNVVFSSPLTNVQYLRFNTQTGSSSWADWDEIKVYGAAPGSQTSTPGIIYSGDSSAVFGQGHASTNDWVVGGLVYPEVFSTIAIPSTTAYKYMFDRVSHAGIPITEITTLTGCASLSNCTLPNDVTNGVYHATGNVTLNSVAFSAAKNYVFLIDGDLTIKGNIIVPNGSTAFFSASGDIVVDRSVGTATNLFPLPSGQVQGIFSADRDFTVDGINNCTVQKDKMLNVEGTIVTNAAGNGGHFRTRRDLCADNPKMPALTVRLRLDFILNAPPVIARQKTTLREEAP